MAVQLSISRGVNYPARNLLLKSPEWALAGQLIGKNDRSAAD
jgi:hypothetical protein